MNAHHLRKTGLVLVLLTFFTVSYAQKYCDKFITYAPVQLNKEEKASLKKYIDGMQFDPSQNLVLKKITEWQYHIDTVGVTYHHIQATFRYACALLNYDAKANMTKASNAILAAIAEQDTLSKSRTRGVWPYYKEEPVATKRTPVDFNMADFNSVVLLDIYMAHHNQLPANVADKIKSSLILAAQCIQKRNQDPSYTNIALMGTYVTYMVSHLFNLPEMQTYAFKRLERFHRYTREKNGFTEYNSPTYTITALNEISRMHEHIVEPKAKAMVDELNSVVWSIIARHFHKPTGQWAGPNSRSYATLLDQNNLYSILYFASNGKVDFGVKRYNPTEIVLKYEMPEKYYSYFLAPQYPRTESDVFEPNEPKITGTSWMDKDFVLSTANRSCLWNQRRPFVAYWGTKDSPCYLQLQFLHDAYDFSSAAIYTSQHNNRVLAGLNLFLAGGDKHIILDKIKTGKFKAKDLRIRFRFGNTVSLQDVTLPAQENQAFSFPLDHIVFNIHLFQSSLDHQKGYWQKGGDGKNSWIDYVLYSGKEKEFDLNSIKEAVWAFTFSMDKPGQNLPAQKVAFDIKESVFKASWGSLNITLPANLLPMGGFPEKSATIVF